MRVEINLGTHPYEDSRQFWVRWGGGLAALSVVSLLLLAYTFGSWARGHVVTGWTSLLTVVLILGSAQLILFGLLGEYVGRLYLETKRRPLFVIDRVLTQSDSASGEYRPASEHSTVPSDV